MVPINMNPNAIVRNSPLLANSVFNKARVKIKRPTTPMPNAIFCFLESA